MMNRLTQKDEQMTLEEAISHAYDCAKEMCNVSCGEQHKQLGDWLTELQQYRQIGTLEECREARDRKQAKKPVIGADFLIGRDDEGNPIWESDYVCPECGMGVAGEYICCPYCGQSLDWEEENDEQTDDRK